MSEVFMDDMFLFGEEDDAPAQNIVEVDGKQVVLDPKKNATYQAGQDYLSAKAEEDSIRSQLSQTDALRKALTAEIDEIKRVAQESADEIRKRIHVIDEETYDLRKSLRDSVRRVEALLRLFRQAIQNETAMESFKASAVEFDRITAGLHWREFAFDHQIEGGKYLAANRRVILGDKMGLGKSLTSLIACDMLQAQRVLIIVPDDIVSNFVHEVYKWAPHRRVLQLGKKTKDERAALIDLLPFLTSYVVVVNYSAWRKDNKLIDDLIAVRFDTIIMDEAHTIKETTTNAYRGCKKIVLAENQCPECKGPIHPTKAGASDYIGPRQYVNYLACNNPGCGWDQNKDIRDGLNRNFGYLRSAVNVFPMTGTPILNKPTDLFALLSLIDPENFNAKYTFEADYCTKDYYSGKVIFRTGGMESLVKRLSGRWLARDRQSAGVVLPKQEVIQHELVLDPLMYPQQYKIIKQLSKYASIILESSGKQLTNMATITVILRKRQANVWPGGITMKDPVTGDVMFDVSEEVNESIKVDWCIDPAGVGHIPDFTADGNMALGDRVVVFSQFKPPLIELEKRLNAVGISVVRFDGDTPNSVKEEIKKDFDRSRCNEPGYEKKWQVVLANYRVGGQGLNLNDATQMILLDSEWNPGKRDQAEARMDRIGQTEESIVHKLSVEHTIDTWLDTLVTDKEGMVEGFEASANLAQALLEAIRNDEML